MSETRYVIAALAIASIVWLAGNMVPSVIPSLPEEKIELNTFGSYSELENYIKTNTETARGWFGLQPGMVTATQIQKADTIGAAAPTTESSSSYSQTNVQVEGVDEADIVKSDGTYLYIVRQNSATGAGELSIVKAYPVEEAKVLSKISWGNNKYISGIYINEDKLIVLISTWGNMKVMKESTEYYYSQNKMGIEVYDVQNREVPTLARNITLDGNYMNSRMIGKYVYVVSAFPTYSIPEEIILPTINLDGEEKKVEATEIYYPNTPDVAYSFTTIFSFNTQDDSQEPVQKTVLTGSASNIYVSLNNIFLTLTKYNYDQMEQMQEYSEETIIYRVKIENGDIKLEAEGSVPGHILNQFSMDEYNGYFRIATTTGQVFFIMRQESSEQANHLYILDQSLKVVGKVENIAQGEKIYSVRFMGEQAYMVTFKKVDPFFIIDVKDPTNPAILGWLKIPGYSDYLHPLDENHIIGLGKDAVPAEEGDFAWYQGVKISLFDVTNVSAPIETSQFKIGERGTDSPALYDHKAFLFNKDTGLMVIPVLVSEINREQYPGEIPANAYGEPVWQGAYVFNVSSDNGIVFKGRITHIKGPLNGDKYNGLDFIQRALYIDNYLYTLSQGTLKINNIDDLAEVATISIT
jgi:inhibitor of cysteine peptidase